MKFVTFSLEQGPPMAGLLIDNETKVLNLAHPAYRERFGGIAPQLISLVQAGLLDWARRISDWSIEPDAVIAASKVRLQAPLLSPSKVMGAAYNFKDALAERGMEHPKEPVVFFRSSTTIIGPDESILVPPDIGPVTYEAELAAVIGKRLIAVGPEEAMKSVVAYMAHNDVSASGLIKEDGGRFVRGKNMPASAPCGPWLVTADEVPDPHSRSIMLSIDGKLLQNGNTRDMLFRLPELISYISHQIVLEPGDIIASGTPAGTAISHTPAAWLTAGQKVSLTVEGLGTLNNPVSF